MSAKSHADRLRRMRNTKDLVRALLVAGQSIELEAERSITAGSVSGKNHVPSLPGQPPNADTRRLDTNIETTIVARGDNPIVHVTSHAPYSAFLEFGTAKMAARPFMRPATQKKKGEAIATISRAVSKLTK